MEAGAPHERPLLVPGEPRFKSRRAALRRVAELEIDKRVAYVDGVSAVTTIGASTRMPACERVHRRPVPERPRLMKSLRFVGEDKRSKDDPIERVFK